MNLNKQVLLIIKKLKSWISLERVEISQKFQRFWKSQNFFFRRQKVKIIFII